MYIREAIEVDQQTLIYSHQTLVHVMCLRILYVSFIAYINQCDHRSDFHSQIDKLHYSTSFPSFHIDRTQAINMAYQNTPTILLSVLILTTLSSFNTQIMVSGARHLLEETPNLPKELPHELPKPQLTPLPTIPTLPKPEVPPLLKPELPHIPETLPKPELPKLPELPKFPEVPKLPELPHLPNVAEMPKPTFPTIPNLPKDQPQTTTP